MATIIALRKTALNYQSIFGNSRTTNLDGAAFIIPGRSMDIVRTDRKN